MRVTSWNLLHGMAIPPSNDLANDRIKLGQGIQAIGADVIGIQEVDEKLGRSGNISQTKLVGEAMGTQYWGFAPVIIGEPGAKWRKLNRAELKVITQENPEQNNEGSYGIGIVSKIPVRSWHRLDLGNSPVGLPLVVPGDETGKGKPRFIYVKDEPRLALAAVLENGWTVVNTHLSFVPVFNLVQLKRVKKWALSLAQETNTRPLILGDLNLPKNLPIAFSSWKSLVSANTYPSWGAKIQFDYLLTHGANTQVKDLGTIATGISDHLPLRAEIN